jgi:hypothetical protein
MSKANADARHKRQRPRRLGSEAEAAALLGVAHESIRNARCTGRGDLATIPWFKYGSARGAPVRYHLTWIEDVWLEQRRRSHPREPDKS